MMYYLIKPDGNIVGSHSIETLRKLQNLRGLTGCTITTELPKREVDAGVQLAAIKTQLLFTVDTLLDSEVQKHGYDNIAKCATYEGDEDPIFNAEGTAAKKWRSKVYRKCYDILAQVEAGERGIPTADELIAELPKLEWPTV